jgi:hypothetical protein
LHTCNTTLHLRLSLHLLGIRTLLRHHADLVTHSRRRLRRLNLLLLQSLELIEHRIQVNKRSHTVLRHAFDVLDSLINGHTLLHLLLKRGHHGTTRAANWTDHTITSSSALAETCCRESTEDTHSKLSLLVRKLLLVNEVLVLLIEHLLIQCLLLTASAQLSLSDAHTLLVTLHTETAQGTCRSQLLLQTL